ncbi:hypothetical protein LEP1GSC186_2387 [Leptospira noguchii serovar Autumnalis str. ZUN142]|uniref:Uncharacterized protein n=1 Tax=Leptospira noguchii serovar Autumnalis str. ZUN142 TaxID=1085540 RepID=M6UEU1_9LEPT|nr:hypothetical protein LEP1GSC186_2387 [Leptospira noguchii serovar Autumnalis str. ZUN142]
MKETNRTLNYEAKAIEVEILRRNMFLSMIVLEYTKKLKCCDAD